MESPRWNRTKQIKFVLLGDYSKAAVVLTDQCAKCSCCSKCCKDCVCGGYEDHEGVHAEVTRTLKLLKKSDKDEVKAAMEYIKKVCELEAVDSSSESSDTDDGIEDVDMVAASEEDLDDDDSDEERVRVGIDTLDVRDIELIE